jgi:hypothetical protein
VKPKPIEFAAYELESIERNADGYVLVISQRRPGRRSLRMTVCRDGLAHSLRRIRAKADEDERKACELKAAAS